MKNTITILFISILLACNSAKNDEVESKKKLIAVESTRAIYGWTGGDTLVSFKMNGNFITVPVKKRKDLSVAIKKFQEFLNEYAGKKLEWKNEIDVDLNGDGIVNEKALTTISVTKDSCFVWKIVYNKYGKVFWSYRHFFSNLDDSWFFGTKEAYKKLKPYSMFYLGYMSSLFDTLSINDKLRNTYAKKLERIADFKNPHDYADMDSVADYLKTFKGKCLRSYWLTYNENLIYLYYEPENQFIAIDPKDTIQLRVD